MSGVESPSMKLRSLPIIDIAPWIHPESEHYRGHNGGRKSTSAALHAACLTYGFFYLDISSFVDAREMDDLAETGRKFFSLPDEVKETLGLGNQDGARGYQRLKENVTNGKADNHEGLDIYAPVAVPDKTKPLHGENQWPSDDMVPGFRKKYEHWVDKMKELGMVVMEAMSVGLGMTPEEWDDLKRKVDDSFWVMRVIGYPPLPNGFDGYSCGAHKDYGCLTFLYADPTPNALQVFLPQPELLSDTATSPIPANATSGLAPSAASALINAVEKSEALKKKSGITNESSSVVSQPADDETGMKGVWISADPIPGCIVCNIGEMWEIWTNGLYKSTLHRVIHRGSNYRVSIPFFFEPNFTARVEPLAAALRLQKDCIQPAYAYTPHTPPIHHPHHHKVTGSILVAIEKQEGETSPVDTLTQRLEALVSSGSAGAAGETSSSSASESGASEDSVGAVTSTTTGTTPRSSLDDGARRPHVKKHKVEKNPQLARVQSAASISGVTPHSHVHTPVSVEKRYSPVVYGEFLTRKVSNNFSVDGKGGRY